LQQVFQNLLSNAVKHMGPPGGEVVVSCLRAPDCWRFCVADNGPGIDARHHQSIFAIFQTVNKQEGMDSTGVGLSIVKKIVEAYNGKVWVESEPGAGAKFFFTLPLAEKSRI
jgi:signal transduction histidine kinase